MISGAREGKLFGLRRLAAAAMARDLRSFIVPGPEIARARGLDFEAAGMRIVASPRHASVLVLVDHIPPALCEAAAVIYAQMPRPRAILALGSREYSALPVADVAAGLSQEDLISGVGQLRLAFTQGAFRKGVSVFDAPFLRIRMEYTCPMHPEVVRNEPGSCPKCGMHLVPREAPANSMHSHAEDRGTETGVDAVPESKHTHHGLHHETASESHQDHPRTNQSEMNHGDMDHGEMDHGEMDHGEMDHAGMSFMSMVDATKDLARSGDGLAMDWIDVPFGPFFPGLPGGLLLTLTLDGDTVAGATGRSLVDNVELLQLPATAQQILVERFTGMEPQAPHAYRFLACRAIENAAGIEIPADTARARVGILERERIASHLGWLVLFGQQTGFDWLQRRAQSLQLKFRLADCQQTLTLDADIVMLIKRLRLTPLLKSRTAGIGRLEPGTALRGPVARAAGIDNDARSADPTYMALGFRPVSLEASDILARLHIRLDEIVQSLTLIEAADAIASPVLADIGEISGSGEAVVETPRGMARLQLTLDKGKVIAARLDTPSTGHLTVVDTITAQQALGDALLAVGSLDLSPWEIRQ